MPSHNEYGTHLPVLKALAGYGCERVLELGGGWWSTEEFLEWPGLTQLVTVETDPKWAKRVSGNDPRHRVVLVGDVAEYVAIRSLDFDLIFVDDSDSEKKREETIRTLASKRPAGVVVIHDLEQPKYRKAAAAFDHMAIFDVLTPWTGVAWNEGSGNRSSRIHRLVARARASLEP